LLQRANHFWQNPTSSRQSIGGKLKDGGTLFRVLFKVNSGKGWMDLIDFGAYLKFYFFNFLTWLFFGQDLEKVFLSNQRISSLTNHLRKGFEAFKESQGYLALFSKIFWDLLNDGWCLCWLSNPFAIGKRVFRLVSTFLEMIRLAWSDSVKIYCFNWRI